MDSSGVPYKLKSMLCSAFHFAHASFICFIISSANGVETTQTKDASTTTDANGEYKFLGVLPGRYLIRYTYDSNTTINGKAIDPREYKSTIISSDVIKNALKLGQADERKGKGAGRTV